MSSEETIAAAPGVPRRSARRGNARRSGRTYRVVIHGRPLTGDEWTDLVARCLEVLGQSGDGTDG